jgi:hypothetical protein
MHVGGSGDRRGWRRRKTGRGRGGVVYVLKALTSVLVCDSLRQLRGLPLALHCQHVRKARLLILKVL